MTQSSTHPVTPLIRAAAITAAAAAIAYAVLLPRPCSGVAACTAAHGAIPSKPNAYVTCGLVMALVYELAGLATTFSGVRETRALVPQLRSRLLPSALLSSMFAIIVAQHWIFAGSPSAWYAHAAPGPAAGGSPIAGRPVYTLTYAEWLVVVPQLMIAAGYCALGRPMDEVAVPMVVTNVYIVFSWVAFLTTKDALRWPLVAAAFLMYGLASRNMVRWVSEYYRTAPADLPSLHVRPCLSLGLVALFAVYAVVYLASITGVMSAEGERMWWMCLDVGAKVAMSISFVAIRASEYHQTLTGLLKKLSTSNVAMVSILRGSFDVLLPCTVDAKGRCMLPPAAVADLLKFEACLGRPATGASLADLLADGDERERFSAYVMNTLRQAEAPQAFSDATLSTGGDWQGQMPPVAQVLNCKMAMGKQKQAGGAGQGGTLGAAIHLSVVPQSALVFGRERRMVAAVRFGNGDGADHVLEEAAGGPAFEEFDVDEARTLWDNEEKSTKVQSSDGGNVIVASLVDMAKLGMSTLFTRGAGSSVADSEIYVASTVLEAMAGASDVFCTHWGALAQMTQVEGQIAASLRGSWTGAVSELLGGYAQTMHFLDERPKVDIDVLGVTLHGVYRLHCDRLPYQMDIQMNPQDDSFPRPAPIRYIFDLDGTSLTLCGPSDSEMSRPVRFEGPGLCMMARAAPCASRFAAPAQGKVATRSSSKGGVSKGGCSSSGVSTALPSGPEAFGRMITDSTTEPEAEDWSRGVTEETSLGPYEAQPAAVQLAAVGNADEITAEDVAPRGAKAKAGVHVVEFTDKQIAMTAAAATALICLLKFARFKF